MDAAGRQNRYPWGEVDGPSPWGGRVTLFQGEFWMKSTPALNDAASIAGTVGLRAATTVDKNMTLRVFIPKKETASTASVALSIFKPLR